MPQISAFYGIRVYMYFGDHNPPHLHARYGRYRARVSLDGSILDGELPRRAGSLLREWCELHEAELGECWAKAVEHMSPGTIEPLT